MKKHDWLYVLSLGLNQYKISLYIHHRFTNLGSKLKFLHVNSNNSEIILFLLRRKKMKRYTLIHIYAYIQKYIYTHIYV
jgi:hypothetical protein